MDRKAYDRYLACFNGRDYDGVIAHFLPDAEIRFAGLTLKGGDAIRSFYAFFHDHVIETIFVDRFAVSDDLLAMEARVRLEAKKDVTRDILEAQGYPQLVTMTKGDVVILPQFIHYHLVNGKFANAVCQIIA